MKRNNKAFFCNCGKELSREEIDYGKTKCENCIGKKAGKVKKRLKVIIGIFGIVGSAILGIVPLFNKIKNITKNSRL